jgi:HSP20 family molecular chaperone IbpA
MRQDTNSWVYRMDLHEDTQTNLVTAMFELPGLAKEILEIDADVINHRLTISGEHNISEDKENKEKCFTVRERRYGKFSRSLPLPPLPHGVEVGWTTSQLAPTNTNLVRHSLRRSKLLSRMAS